jgi:uncharacterized protein (TIGR02147 family)
MAFTMYSLSIINLVVMIYHNEVNSMSIYEFSSYKKFLETRIASFNRRGIKTELALRAGCDRTYLSQVLSGRAHLTSDHAINLAAALSLSDEESDYFMLLVMIDRSGQPEAKKRLLKRADKIREANLAVSKTVAQSGSATVLNEQTQLKYYSSWKYAAVHISTSIHGGQTSIAASDRLLLSVNETEKILEELCAMKLVRKSGHLFEHNGINLHIPENSPLVRANHLNWRLRAMERGQASDGSHYTTVFTVSKEEVSSLKARLLEFIGQQRKQIHASGSEEIYAFCCDLFEV